MSDRYFIDVGTDSGEYWLNIHHGDPKKSALEASPALGPSHPIADSTLGAIVEELGKGSGDFLLRRFDERLQLEVGRHLYNETLGRLEASPPTTEAEIDVDVVTDDEHVALLPWTLLTRGPSFLSTLGWSIALRRPGRPSEDLCILPPSPRMLVVAPQPDGEPETGAEAHLEDLKLLLASANRHFEREDHFAVATTWDDFRRLAEELRPDVFYYYGHGEGDTRTTRLVFADGDNHRLDVPVADVAQYLRRAGWRPVLAYVNCCRGDVGGLLGAGWQLGEIVPAVVTNRTTAYIDAAQLQARHFWRAVLLDGEKPHRALAEMYSHLGAMGLGFRDARWLTPVLHRHYEGWESHPPRPRQRIDDPHWQVKLDRVRQFGQVVFQAQKMLNNRRPPCLAYLWYGEEGQGVDLFHQRLKVELGEFLGSGHLYEVRPRWPDVLREPFYPFFEEMMLEAFDVLALADIPGRVRAQTGGESGRDTLVYVRHQPLRRGEVMKPGHLPAYLRWWDEVFIPTLQDAPAFGLLGVSFVVERPAKLLREIGKHGVEGLELRHVVLDVLDELERLARKDLLDFLKAHNVVLPSDYRDRILDDVLKRTGGHYEATLVELRDLVHRGWDERESAEEEGEEEEEEEAW